MKNHEKSLKMAIFRKGPKRPFLGAVLAKMPKMTKKRHFSEMGMSESLHEKGTFGKVHFSDPLPGISTAGKNFPRGGGPDRPWALRRNRC
tara:strand:- start:161 stop:430 length:270 start_codon:yes stop_codon:yes gene_type:complete